MRRPDHGRELTKVFTYDIITVDWGDASACAYVAGATARDRLPAMPTTAEVGRLGRSRRSGGSADIGGSTSRRAIDPLGLSLKKVRGPPISIVSTSLESGRDGRDVPPTLRPPGLLLTRPQGWGRSCSRVEGSGQLRTFRRVRTQALEAPRQTPARPYETRWGTRAGGYSLRRLPPKPPA